MVANFVADVSSSGFFMRVTIPMMIAMREMSTSNLKSKFDGNKPVNGINRKETVAKNAQITLTL